MYKSAAQANQQAGGSSQNSQSSQANSAGAGNNKDGVAYVDYTDVDGDGKSSKWLSDRIYGWFNYWKLLG